MNRRQLLIALALIVSVVLALLIDRTAFTDKGRVRRAIRDMCKAAEKTDTDLLFSHFSREYADETLALPLLRSVAEEFFQRSGPLTVRVEDETVAVSGGLAVAELRISARSEPQGYRGVYGRSTWQLEFRRDADRIWRVTRITPMRLGVAEVRGWRDALRAGGLTDLVR